MDNSLFDEIPISRTRIAGQSVFPLAIAPVELFMKWDHSAGYPKRFRVRMNFAEPLDRDRCVEALSIAIARHPLLLAALTADEWIAPTSNWVIPDNPTFLFKAFGPDDVNLKNNRGQADRNDDLASNENDSMGIAPSRFSFHTEFTPAVESSDDRVAVSLVNALEICNSGAVCQLLLDIPHHRCDGLAAREFVRDFLIVYDSLSANNDFESRLPVLDYQQLAVRDIWHRPAAGSLSRETTLLEKIVNAIKFHSLRPCPIGEKSTPKKKENSPSFGDRLVERCTVLESKEFTWLRDAVRSGGSLHQHTLVSIAGAIQQWPQKSPGNLQSKPERETYRLMMPVSLRSHADRSSSACNRIGFGFVVFRKGWPTERLVSEIHRQSNLISTRQLGFDFAEGLTQSLRSKTLRSFLRKSLPSSSLATTVVTNLGDVSRRIRRRFDVVDNEPVIGGARLVSVSGIAPLRPFSRLGVGLCVSSGRLAISTFIDERYVGENSPDLHELIVKKIMNPSQIIGSPVGTHDSEK